MSEQEVIRKEDVAATAGTPDEETRLDDQAAARRAEFGLAITRFGSRAAVASVLAMVVLWLIFRQYTQFLVTAALGGVAATGAGLYSLFHRRGRAILGAHVFLFSLLVLFATLPFTFADISSVAIGYAILLVLGYLLLGDKGARWLIGVTVVAFCGDLILLKSAVLHLFPPLEATTLLTMTTTFGVVTLLAAAVIFRQITLGQEGHARQAQRAQWEVERRISAEREQRERLEQAKLEIERRAAVEQEQRERLQRVVEQAREVANRLGSASSEILAATTQQALGASEQSAAIAQASSTIDEVRAIAGQTSQRAQGVAEMAQRAADVSRSGQQAVAETIAGMGRIRQKVEGIATTNLALSEQAQAIGQVIATVNEIAAQSNMLALNAAVEAARAGEAGRGFAVVAGEVRSLAEQSRAATVQVKEMLSEIQRGVNAAVMATEEGMKEADAGTKLAGESGLALQRLADSVVESAQAATQIAASAAQQLTGMEQIASAMGNIHQVTEQTVASTQQSERAAAELDELAANLREVVVRRYQL
jgi:methyl-accepting chemotaxis protein